MMNDQILLEKVTMKSQIFAIICLFCVATAHAVSPPAIIPVPQKMELHEGRFSLGPDTRIYVDFSSRETGDFLAAKLRQSTGYKFKVVTKRFSSQPVRDGILLTTKSASTNLGPEGYELTVTTNSIVIRAPEPVGLFYGAQTLLQLLPPEIFATKVVAGFYWQMPCVQIVDWPRFKWRGLMLDVSRHFYNKQEVERLLDQMARFKLNRFHWHLVDDHGWRIEIKKYPKLTDVGAWRSGVGFNIDPKSTTAYGPDGRYGGFYTQADIREVVAYAAARHITIVPEIEMPGHSLAALAAYPQYGCTSGPFTVPVSGGVFNGIYNPANEETFRFLENVLTEVFELFPSRYIHIGGDEVRKETWKNSPECQALMKREGLKNEEELQSWFIRRIEKFVNAHSHALIGWSEILQGGLAKSAVVMDWIGGGKEAAAEGHNVIMTPTGFCYFDYCQSLDHSLEPHAFAAYLPLRKVYSFEPIPAGLTPPNDSYVLGGQANVWTEYIAATTHLEYMIFPRLDALAEVVWSPKDSRNWEDFQRRLKVDEQRLDELGVNHRHDNTVKLGEWTPSQLSTTNVTMEWDVTGKVKGPGQYHVTLNYDHGDNGLTIVSLALLENGHEIARDNHAGFTGVEQRKPVYVLDLPAFKQDAHYSLQANVRGEGGKDSHGSVGWVFVPNK
jgi:hexosaminidase